MPKRKSDRNKTIELNDKNIEQLEQKLLTVDRKHQQGELLNTTILGDTLEVIDYLPQRFVDLLIIDPPYNMNKVFGAKQFKKMGNDDYEEWVRSWLGRLVPVLNPNASIYICGDWQSSSALFRVMSDYFKIRNRITWEREKGRGAKTNWKNASEDIWFATMGDEYYFDVDAVKLKKKVIAPYRDNSGNPKDWSEEKKGNFRLTHPSNLWTDLSVPFWSMAENTEHPTQKPEKLIAKIILASSAIGSVVLDPFLGSGTTSVVAKKLGRQYLGIEIDKYFACVAEKRLQMADKDKRIQGYADGVFWERNINPKQFSSVDDNQQRLLL